jgi:hypothetical protein
MSKLHALLAATTLSLLAAGPALADRTEDREAIEALMWKYARALDTGNGEAYAALYTEDGQFGVGDNAVKGREALRGLVGRGGGAGAAGAAPPQLLHMTADSWIEFIDDTHAKHHSYWLTMRMASQGQPASVAAIGVGVDELVKVNGQWLIQVRNVNAPAEAAAQTTSVLDQLVGTWNLAYEGGVTGTFTISKNADGTPQIAVTTDQGGQSNARDIVITNDTITFARDIALQGQTGSVNYTAKLVDGKLEGTGLVNLGGGAGGAPGGGAPATPTPFTATKAQ